LEVIHYEPLYTLSEARKIIQQQERKDRKNYIKQKLAGFALIIISVVSPILLETELTITLFLFCLGIYLVFTKDKAWGDWDEI